MLGGDWRLEPVADFIFLLSEKDESKNILRKRFKKDANALTELFQIIEKIDELGYDNGTEFAFSHQYMDTVKGNGALGLIEIRVKKKLWRVITYWDQDKKLFVMLDAFEAHKHKTMTNIVKLVKPRLEIVKELLKEVGSDGHEDDAQ